MKKKIAIILVMVLIVSILSFSLCACNKDKDGNGDVNTGVNFEGMTQEEIIKMVDEGKITSFTYIMQGKGEDFYYSYEYSDLGLCLKNFYNGKLMIEQYYLYDDEYCYEFYCEYNDDTPEIGYYKYKKGKDIEHNVSEGFKEIIGEEFTIEGNKLVFGEDEYDIFYIYKVNASEWTIPEKYSNYKELAVEVND